jgi:D-beta-D-heptose 7-phosphate kinase/D-beta-D-heptose 1-phosphate adenosyltransferase
MRNELAEVIPRLERVLGRFRKLRVAVLGDLMLDRYLWGMAHRLSPEAAVPVVDFVSQNDCLGGAGNVAANIVALGAKVQIYGVLGGKRTKKKQTPDDEAGTVLRNCLHRAGIDDAGVLADFCRMTTVKTRVIARHQQIVRIDHENHNPIATETGERLFRLLLGSLKNLDALVFSDYDKGVITEGLAVRVLHAGHQLKVPVFVKPKASRVFRYDGARAVVCNAKEASFYVGRSVADDKSIEETARALMDHFGCAAMVITRGEKGMSVCGEGSERVFHIPATSFEVTYARVGQAGVSRGSTGRQVFDVTGAGDTVLSALSLAVAAGANLAEAAFLANAAAGVVVGKLGTATVTVEELLAALHDIDRS